MNKFTRQFSLGLISLVVGAAAVVVAHKRYSSLLPAYDFITGWFLLAIMIFLAAYNGRKKLPFLPLGSSEAWLQLHIYLGFFTAVLFGVHIGFRLPRGLFESALAGLYGLVMLSGMLGLFISRIFPRRLSARGGEVLYEKIPALRHDLRLQAEALTLGAAKPSRTLSEFYVKRLNGFFARPRYPVQHLVESQRPLKRLIAELDDLRRYIAEDEQSAWSALVDLVRRKDTLDYHFCLQRTIRLWLFVHLPLTWSLLIFTAMHVALVYGFSGGAK
jgi:hypothetical protein